MTEVGYAEPPPMLRVRDPETHVLSEDNGTFQLGGICRRLSWRSTLSDAAT